ncbi:MAG: hypothetical protein ACP5VP_01935 [Candidatus Limnocylindrales bacterium]
MSRRCPPASVACSTASWLRVAARSLAAVSSGRFYAQAAAWSVAALLAFGLVAAIIPNPVFGRSVPPEPFAIAVWLVSAPLMGLIAATYGQPARLAAASMATAQEGSGTPVALGLAAGAEMPAAAPTAGSTVATVGGFAAFLAIGCPLCNKVALLLLGASGALSVYAPLQPIIGAISLALLAGTLVWRLRLLAVGGSCAVPAQA